MYNGNKTPESNCVSFKCFPVKYIIFSYKLFSHSNPHRAFLSNHSKHMQILDPVFPRQIRGVPCPPSATSTPPRKCDILNTSFLKKKCAHASSVPTQSFSLKKSGLCLFLSSNHVSECFLWLCEPVRSPRIDIQNPSVSQKSNAVCCSIHFFCWWRCGRLHLHLPLVLLGTGVPVSHHNWQPTNSMISWTGGKTLGSSRQTCYLFPWQRFSFFTKYEASEALQHPLC